MTSPSPGWYPSPDQDPNWLQYWDGVQWTGDRAPALPVHPGAVASPLAPSGLRRVRALFTDFGRIFRRAWWPVTAIALVLWGAWSLLAAAVAVVLRLGDWADLWAQFLDFDGNYPDGMPLSVQNELEQQATDLFQQIGAGTFIAAGAVVIIAAILVACAQSAAVLRIGAEAASGRPATVSVGWAGARRGTLRILGYNLVIGLPFVAAYALLIGVISITQNIAAVIVATLAMIAALVVTFALYGKLLPALVQATVPNGAGALSWSWNVTKGKFWAVLGRYLLWVLVVSLVVNIVYPVLVFPLMFGGIVLLMLAPAWVSLLLGLLGITLTAVFSGFSLLGYVPIWRDLTTDPDYRAIDDNGFVISR